MVAVLVLVLALVAPDLASRQAPRAPLATLASGTVQGSWSSSRAGRLIASYQGIPYAAPPLGQLRFKTPRPPLSWSGVLNATAPGPECPQRPFLSKKRQIVGDEDCLFINVHTPEHAGPDTQLDVLVFIHGGAYSQRSGADFKPKYLLDHDVVLVTFNYRLGPLGFLSTQDEIIPGNAGLKDQVLALRWVQHNIAAFGGNRNNVLVFGESAGASSVELLMMSPLAKGLFHRAALQSGSVLCPWAFSPPGEPLHYAARLAEVLQCPAEPSSALRDCLLTRSAQDIMAVEYDLLEFGILPVSMFKPVVEVAGAEGAFLTRHPEELLASGLQSDVPLMIGVNSHEGGLWAVAHWTAVRNFCNEHVSQMEGQQQLLAYIAEIDSLLFLGCCVQSIHRASEEAVDDPGSPPLPSGPPSPSDLVTSPPPTRTVPGPGTLSSPSRTQPAPAAIQHTPSQSVPETEDAQQSPIPTSSGASTPSSSKKGRVQAYRTAWEAESEFKGWLRRDTANPARAMCTKCNQSLEAKKSVLTLHAKGSKHKQKVASLDPDVQDTLSKFVSQSTPLDDKVKDAEIMLSAFVATHYIPFRAMDHLPSLCAKLFPDSQIAQKLHMKRDKTRAIVTNVIGAEGNEQIANICKGVKFSILIDESTDIASTKTCAIVVRFYDDTKGRVVTKFWELVQIFTADNPDGAEQGATAARLFDLVVKSFNDRKVPLDNVIGFGSDGANVMVGEHNSVASRFRQQCRGIYLMSCICHSLDHVASEACKTLPRKCEELARAIYNFFKHSSKRMAQFKEFQEFAEVNVLKMLHPSATRWLSLRNVVRRILDQWNALVLFFDMQWLQEKLRSAEEIHNWLHDPWQKAYFLFLDWVLQKVAGLNEYFQTEKVVLPKMHQRITEQYRELLQSYMKRESTYRIPLHIISPNDAELFLPLHHVYLGANVHTHLTASNFPADMVTDFKGRCRQFLIKSCEEIKKRYRMNDDVLSRLAPLLSPDAALSHQVRDQTPTLAHLMLLVPRIKPDDSDSVQRLDDQWRSLPGRFQVAQESLISLEPDQFWHKILTHPEESHQDLARFALGVLSLPHSNAECERTFSKINSMKTKRRSRLITPTINGMLWAQQRVQWNSTCCLEFQSSKTLRSRMTKSMYQGYIDLEEGEEQAEGEDVQ